MKRQLYLRRSSGHCLGQQLVQTPSTKIRKKKKNFTNVISKVLIVFGSFIIYFIADGTSLSFGIHIREIKIHLIHTKNSNEIYIILTNFSLSKNFPKISI